MASSPRTRRTAAQAAHTADQAESRWDRASQAGQSALHHVKDALGSNAGLLRDRALVLADGACRQSVKHLHQSKAYLRGHPWHGFALAVAAGAVLTAWITRRPR